MVIIGFICTIMLMQSVREYNSISSEDMVHIGIIKVRGCLCKITLVMLIR